MGLFVRQNTLSMYEGGFFKYKTSTLPVTLLGHFLWLAMRYLIGHNERFCACLKVRTRTLSIEHTLTLNITLASYS